MKKEELNEDTENWLKLGNGYHHAYKIVAKEFYENLQSGNILLNLLSPIKFLFLHSVESYLKMFLVLKGEAIKKIIGLGHNLEKLRKLCATYDTFFEDEKIKHLDVCVGSDQNYAGTKYPEGLGGDDSSLYPEILKMLDEFVKNELK